MNVSIAAFAVGLSGFVALSYEILWYRALTIASNGWAGAFGLLLAFYLGGLAIGARFSGAWCERIDSSSGAGGRPTRQSDLRLMVGTFAFFLLANGAAALVLPAFAWTTAHGAWVAALVFVAVAAGLLGGILPLVSQFAVPPDARAGHGLSLLYAANILGSVAGSFLTGFVLLDLLATRTVAVLLLAFGCLAATTLLILSRPPLRMLLLGVGAAIALAGGGSVVMRIGFTRYYERLLYGASAVRAPDFTQVVENRSGVITVTPDGTVYGSGAYDGRITTDLMADRNAIVRAYAVTGLHPAPRSVLMIGLGGGAWAQVVANHPSVQRLTIVEINPGYYEVIARHSSVASLLSNPKVEFVIDDGRRWLTRNPEARFDLIVANTTWHWRPHATNLLSREFLGLVRRHLRNGGVYYFNTTFSPAVIRTAMTEYPYGVRVLNFAAVSDAPLSFDRSRFRAVLTRYAIDGRPVLDLTTSKGLQRLAEVADSIDVEDRQGVLAKYGQASLVTDDNMYPEWHPSPPQWPEGSRPN